MSAGWIAFAILFAYIAGVISAAWLGNRWTEKQRRKDKDLNGLTNELDVEFTDGSHGVKKF